MLSQGTLTVLRRLCLSPQAIVHTRRCVRHLTTTTLKRPSLPVYSSPLFAARPPSALSPSASVLASEMGSGSPDILPKPSSHLAMAMTQIRCGPRNRGETKWKLTKRRYGFLARNASRGGRMILKRRRAKGKKHLTW